VLRLLGSGRSNREIAATLTVSVRTAERHITNVYTKINARSRMEAAAYARAHGLTLRE
jgi:DNA-binding NarL/FixJ family response regulator